MNQLKYIKPEKLAEMVGDENVAEMLQSYRDSLAVSLTELELSFRNNQRDKVHFLAHKLKSSTRFIGADQLADEFLMLEEHTAGDDMEGDIFSLLQSITEQVGMVEQDIDNYMKR